jgi:hypothetical protein
MDAMQTLPGEALDGIPDPDLTQNTPISTHPRDNAGTRKRAQNQGSQRFGFLEAIMVMAADTGRRLA